MSSCIETVVNRGNNKQGKAHINVMFLTVLCSVVTIQLDEKKKRISIHHTNKTSHKINV